MTQKEYKILLQIARELLADIVNAADNKHSAKELQKIVMPVINRLIISILQKNFKRL